MVPGIRLVILGKQGAGKGTQCARLAHHYVVPHISTGEMFRATVRSESEVGKRLKEIMDSGELVPDDVTIEAVALRLGLPDVAERGFILDGFPRNVPQADELSKILQPADVDLAIDLEIPTEVALDRLASRRVCEECQTNYSVEQPPEVDWKCDVCGGRVHQRDDDTPAAILRRLRIYEQDTEPLIAFYLERDRLVTVDALGTEDDVTARLVRSIDTRRERDRKRTRA
ncbi:MAG TPA: adenylate kinase [Acidimicrobiales bacterium]|nr:adenylate kinase [Acidimicrobiales bacterium]